ncbi:MAG: O-antigen ligase family protein, partial [Rubripirellula sp.]
MAKKRHVTNQRQRKNRDASLSKTAATSNDEVPTSSDRLIDQRGSLRDLDPLMFALASLSAALVFVVYYPSDSVAVEKGDALWFAVIAISVGTLAWASYFRSTPRDSVPTRNSAPKTLDVATGTHPAIERVLAWAPWALCGWIFLAAFMTCPPGNLRMATNESWLWVSGAAIFTAARLLMRGLGGRRAMFALMVLCAVGLSVHGLHQYFFSLPQNRLEYQQDPDRVLALAGIDAPPGSAERMVFANRLFDGGPTATFALANSLAAALLFGVVLAVGVLWYRWRSLSLGSRAMWFAVSISCAGCLMAARSRSATIAMLISIAVLWLGSTRLTGLHRRKIIGSLTALLIAAIAGALFLGAFGNREWFEEAPASLAFRFQYWRSTWQLALDHPLFGIGPGNFQSLYERYREASATEQIAEPHNLFFETLATGGFTALILLSLLIGAGVMCHLKRSGNACLDEDADRSLLDEEDVQQSRWVWLGATVSLVMVWLIGFAVRFPPDIAANLFVLPITIGVGFAIWPAAKRLGSSEIDAIIAAAMLGIS